MRQQTVDLLRIIYFPVVCLHVMDLLCLWIINCGLSLCCLLSHDEFVLSAIQVLVNCGLSHHSLLSLAEISAMDYQLWSAQLINQNPLMDLLCPMNYQLLSVPIDDLL